MTTTLTLLDTSEVATSQSMFAEELQSNMSAVRLAIHWFGTRRSVSASQKNRAAETFDAESNFVSMDKKLIDTQHHAWKNLVAVRGKITTLWKDISLPYPESGIRLIKRRHVDRFTQQMTSLQGDLCEAERELDNHYDELRNAARRRLGSLYSSGDYPASMLGLFRVEWDFPNVEPPDYLRLISPNLYQAECERVRSRFEEAVSLAEDAFFSELAKLVEHLTERLSGTEDGKPKIFRDTVVTNLLDFFERFKRLNIGSSDELDRMVSDVQGIIDGITPTGLRNNQTLRQHVSTELSRVQASLDGLMVNRPRRNLLRRKEGES